MANRKAISGPRVRVKKVRRALPEKMSKEEWVEEIETEELPVGEDTVLAGEASRPQKVVGEVKPASIGTLEEIKAQTFAGLIQKKGIVGAAMEVGERRWMQFIAREEVREQVMKVIQGHYLPPDARKALVRAGFNKLAIEGLASDDPTSKKIALDALKSIAADQEVGINQNAAVQVSIDMTTLKDVLEDSSLPDVVLEEEGM